MTWALELQDRASAIARDGEILNVAPSARANRASAPWIAEADLRARLIAAQVQPSDTFWCVASAAIDSEALGTELALARRAGAAVGGFIDGATLSVASLNPQRDALVFEIGLRHVGVTSVAAGPVTRKRRSVISRQSGWFGLCDAWLALIRSIMVNRTRVDPLAKANTERSLLDQLPALAREAAATGTSAVRLDVNEQTIEIVLTSDQLAAAAEPVTRELASLAAQLLSPGIAVDIIAPIQIATLPGLDTLFNSLTRAGAQQLLLPDGFAAAAASLHDAPPARGSEIVPFVRRAPASAHAMLQELVVHGGRTSDKARSRPTHVLYAGQAIALGGRPLTVGRAGAGGNAIELPDSAAGISRLHCTFVSNDEDVALIDHSRFGTLVNGEKVHERACIQAGDRVQIGHPGVELAVIAVGQT